MEKVIVCQSVWTSYDPNRSAFSMSEHDWLLVEVNLLWRRATATHGSGRARMKIPFVCRFCNVDMVDKAHLGFHRQMDQCPCYDSRECGPLKIYPSRGKDGNGEARNVFKKYNLKVPWQMLGKHARPRGRDGTGGERHDAGETGLGEEGRAASAEEEDGAGEERHRECIHLSSPETASRRGTGLHVDSPPPAKK